MSHNKNNSELIRSIRSLRVYVVHERDREGEELFRQLNRIGCHAQAVWPMPAEIPVHTDVVFLAINDRMPRATRQLLRAGAGEDAPTVIGVVDYENPGVLQMVLDLEVQAVITKPLRPFGVLTSLAIARKNWQSQVHKDNALAKLETKLHNVRKLSQAKLILMRMHDMSEEQAYTTIRRRAMSTQTTTEDIAAAIIDADDILSGTPTQH